jgi:hypothetical protein
MIIYIIGAVFKITHAPRADLLIKMSSGILIASLLMAVAKVLRVKNKDHFLNQ